MSINDLSSAMSPGGVPLDGPGERAALTGLTWSTQAISELVGITVRTLRYYHQIGLLPEPERTTRGLVYDETHLLALLRIKRFSMMSLTLNEIADIIHTPASPRARRILLDLDQALADRVAEIESQRRVIDECLRDNTPVDVLPRFARHLAALRRLGSYDTSAADKALEELASGYGSEEVTRVVEEVIQDPVISRLCVLEERLRRLGEDSGEPELADLAKDYGQLLVDLYTLNAQAGLESVSGNDLVEAIELKRHGASRVPVPEQAPGAFAISWRMTPPISAIGNRGTYAKISKGSVLADHGGGVGRASNPAEAFEDEPTDEDRQRHDRDVQGQRVRRTRGGWSSSLPAVPR